MPRPARRTPRAERTRAAILEAAEQIFAQKGFAATRLEDVAEQVGIRRASIVYYFKDKRELYDEVLAGVFGGLLARIEKALAKPGSLAERVEQAVVAWVDYVGARPSLARILLREAASAGGETPAVVRHTQPFFEVVRRAIAASAGDPLPRASPVDAAHAASAIAGATVFFVAAMPVLVPELGFDPLTPEYLEAHREEVLRITRRLLATRGPRPRTRPA